MVRTIQFIERRRFQRLDAAGSTCAVSADQTRPALCRLDLQDVSDGGLAAVSRVQLSLTQPVTVILPPGTLSGRFGRTVSAPGHIVRCRRAGEGYEVAVAFDQPPTIAG